MLKETREKLIKRKRNYLPTLIVTISLWTFLAFIIYFIEPETIGAVPIFIIFLFLAFLFSFSLLLTHTRRGLLISIFITGIAVLRYFGVASVLNIALLAFALFFFELYFIKK